jgi:hypothetical protein
MGDIGPNRVHYDVLPVPEVGIDDADDWTVAPNALPLAGGPPAEAPGGALTRGSGAEPARG